jgi:hypothetical protein
MGQNCGPGAMPRVNICLAPITFARAALVGAAVMGFGLAQAGAQATQTAQIPNAAAAATASPDAAVPATVAPGAGAPADAGAAGAPGGPPENGGPPARPAPGRLAQGEPPPVAEPRAAPSAAACDDACVRQAADFAAQTCVPLIEAKAPVDSDWLSRPFGGMFTQAEKPGADGLIRYRGDSIRILTQNQWLRYAYECAFDPVARKIVSVQLRPGRLVPPAEVAQLAGAPVGQPGPQPAQQQAQAGQQGGQPPPPAKPRPHFGEPSPISITQAHPRPGQIDSLIRISQVSGGGTSGTRRRQDAPR